MIMEEDENIDSFKEQDKNYNNMDIKELSEELKKLEKLIISLKNLLKTKKSSQNQAKKIFKK